MISRWHVGNLNTIDVKYRDEVQPSFVQVLSVPVGSFKDIDFGTNDNQLSIRWSAKQAVEILVGRQCMAVLPC